MCRRLAFAAALLLGWSLAAGAEPLDAALQQQLLALYDAYNRAIAAGKIDDALKTRSASAEKEIRQALKTPKQRKDFLEMSRSMTPDALDVTRATLSQDGSKAKIVTLARKTIPASAKRVPGAPPPGSEVKAELTLDFVKEKGGWRYDAQTFGLDPGAIAACPDERFEPIEAYDQDKDLSLGGPVVRVAFNPDHTLVVVRVVDEETCAFLPERETLEKAGFDPNKLTQGAIVEIAGFPHKSDKQKVWIDRIDVRGGD